MFENIDFFGRLFGQNRAERERRIAGLLESTGLAKFPDRPAGKLSGGMKQKVSLCCALIHDPDLLILDEPTTGVDPLSRLEFLLGKQLPYVVLAMLNFLLLVLLAVTLFGVPVKGSFLTLTAPTLLYAGASTAIGLLISSFMRSQIAAIFGTSVLTILPATQLSGMINPVSSLEGVGALIGQIYPTTHYVTIARGTFTKALGFSELRMSFVPLLIVVPVLLALSMALLKKQET